MDFRILVIEEGDANYAVYELCDGEAFLSVFCIFLPSACELVKMGKIYTIFD